MRTFIVAVTLILLRHYADKWLVGLDDLMLATGVVLAIWQDWKEIGRE